MIKRYFTQYFSLGIMISIFLVGAYMIIRTVFAVNIGSSVVVQNATPTVPSVTLNAGGLITLTPNTTTNVSVSFQVSDNNGCADVFTSGNVTTTIYRTALGSTCTSSNKNCYIASAVTSNDCASGSTANATTTFAVQYFADSTSGTSSTYPSDTWTATVGVRDSSAATASANSSNVEMDVTTSINVTTSSINYGNMSANSTSTVDSTTTVANVGNSTTTLQLYASATLTSTPNSISTSSQHYATSSFNWGGSEQPLSATAATVNGFNLTIPTSTAAVQSTVFWKLQVPTGTATGTYTGTNVFSSLWSQ